MDGLIRERVRDLTGILNGADYAVWNPELDTHLVCRYDRSDVSGKRVCKAHIQAELGLDPAPDVPLIAFLSRIAHQKMADVVAQALPRLMEREVQFALIADGDRELEQAFRDAAARYPGRIAVRIGYREPLAHRLQAGADLLLHPSRFEPCGLAPMYAMRYGALPIVRKSGGQVDVVVHACRDTISQGNATGFSFIRETEDDMMGCIDQAIALYRQPVAWRRIQREAMRQDFDWQRPAEQYLALYHAVARAPIDSRFRTRARVASLAAHMVRTPDESLPGIGIRVASERP
jgi:starch synthase